MAVGDSNTARSMQRASDAAQEQDLPAAGAREAQPLQRQSVVPLYHQIVSYLRAEIQSGTFAPGDPLPSEAALQEQFQVSRVTVRRALRELQRDGLVTSKKGKGSFVTFEPIEHELDTFQTLTDALARYGFPRQVELLFYGEVKPPPAVRADLQLAATEKALLVKRRHLANGVPVALTVMHVAPQFTDGLTADDFLENPIYDLMETKGIPPVQVQRLITATSATREVAAALDVPVGSPTLTMLSRSHTGDGIPVESSVFFFHPRRYSFLVRFSSEGRSSVRVMPSNLQF